MAHEAGKGSKPRPLTDRAKYEAEMDRLFPRKQKERASYPPLDADWDEKRMDIIGSNGNDGLGYTKDDNNG